MCLSWGRLEQGQAINDSTTLMTLDSMRRDTLPFFKNKQAGFIEFGISDSDKKKSQYKDLKDNAEIFIKCFREINEDTLPDFFTDSNMMRKYRVAAGILSHEVASVARVDMFEEEVLEIGTGSVSMIENASGIRKTNLYIDGVSLDEIARQKYEKLKTANPSIAASEYSNIRDIVFAGAILSGDCVIEKASYEFNEDTNRIETTTIPIRMNQEAYRDVVADANERERRAQFMSHSWIHRTLFNWGPFRIKLTPTSIDAGIEANASGAYDNEEKRAIRHEALKRSHAAAVVNAVNEKLNRRREKYAGLSDDDKKGLYAQDVKKYADNAEEAAAKNAATLAKFEAEKVQAEPEVKGAEANGAETKDAEAEEGGRVKIDLGLSDKSTPAADTVAVKKAPEKELNGPQK